MNIFKSLKGIFKKKKQNGLEISDLLIGKEYNYYREYLRHKLRFEPVIKANKSQIVFFNVVFEDVKFENFAFEVKEVNGTKQVTAVYLSSTYEEKDKARAKLHQVRKEFCAKSKSESDRENVDGYITTVHDYEIKKCEYAVSLGM